jgi:hypothetical protein
MPSEADVHATAAEEREIAKEQREQARDEREIQKYKEEREARQAEEARQHEYHQARMAQLQLGLAASASQATATAATANDLGEPLPPGVKSLELRLPGVTKRDYLDIFKGTFDPVNLARLRVHTARIEIADETRIENGTLVTRKAKADRKLFAEKGVWFEGFTNYVVIAGTLCTCPPDLIASMLLWMNTIRTLSTQYIWVSCILDLALDYHTFVMTNGQLEPANWQMPAQYTAPYLMMSSTIGFAALKRPRSDTSYTSNTCRRFNTRGCDDTPCRYPHKCSKCGKDHAASSKSCA